MRIALYQPDIPQNAGTLLRLAACLGLEAHIIEPAGFPTTDRAFRRAGFRRIHQRSFNGALNVADGTAYLFVSAAGSTKAFAVLKHTLEKPGGVSQRVTPLLADGLGEEAWAAHVTGGGGRRRLPLAPRDARRRCGHVV